MNIAYIDEAIDQGEASSVVTLLRMAGHTVTAFTNYENASSTLIDAIPDLIIARVRMANQRGAALFVSRIRSDERFAQVQLFAVYNPYGTSEKTIKDSGFDAWMTSAFVIKDYNQAQDRFRL
jgi:response regulator RpfG family c-di-GMP phosphodiesterase